MKYISFLSLFLFTGSAYSQKMVDNVNYNKFTEVTGTNYVIATFEDWSKKGPIIITFFLLIQPMTKERKLIFQSIPILKKLNRLE